MVITRKAILSKTQYGLGIYSHILRQFYPDVCVLRIKGRDCGLCLNPFSEGSASLHIWIEKSDPGNALSSECAYHRDLSHSIPDGDAIVFAEFFYKLSGAELLKKINEDMHLHIGERWSFNRYVSSCANGLQSSTSTATSVLPEFSFFHAPIQNRIPFCNYTLRDVYLYLKDIAHAEHTKELRTITDHHEASSYKKTKFDFVTFSGTFAKRNSSSLIKHSGYLCIDFDNLSNLHEIKELLLHDEYFETQLLFRSPSGNGLKWIINIDISSCDHETYFNAVRNYLHKTYDLELDRSGKDVCRSCFLPYDPDAYINPSLL